MLIILLSAIAATFYLASAAMIALPLVRQTSRRVQRQGLATAYAAVLLHAFVLTRNLIVHHGLDLHFFAALSVVGCALAGLCLLVNRFQSVAALGVIVFPLAATLLLIDLATPYTPTALEWQIKLHAAFALLGYSVLSIAALLAISLTVQEKALRQHNVGGLLRVLPPLTLTEALMFQLIGAGFVLLTFTLLTGVLFVDNLFAQHLVHKTVLSIAAWLTFGILLFGRWRYGWRGRRAVRFTLSGMALLLLAFFGSRFVLELLLHRT